MMTRYILVTQENATVRVPRVLEDYIYSLNIINDVIHIEELTYDRIFTTTDIFIITQMWIDINKVPIDFIQSGRIIYLNVEMLTEIYRMNHVIDLVKYGFKILDYSYSNLLYFNKYVESHQLKIGNINTHYLPYQYNLRDQVQLANIDGVYTYDVGVINAMIKRSETVSSDLTYRRTQLWEQLQLSGLNCINILGWGAERDELIKRCKVIINVHHFECYNVFEQIRCDRLIFAKKMIISDKSVFVDKYDMAEYVWWEDYDNIIPRAKELVNNFEKYNDIMKSLSIDDVIQNRRNQLFDTLTKL